MKKILSFFGLLAIIIILVSCALPTKKSISHEKPQIQIEQVQ